MSSFFILLRLFFASTLALAIISCKEKGPETFCAGTVDTAKQIPQKTTIAKQGPDKPQAEVFLTSDQFKIFGDAVSFEDFHVDIIDSSKVPVDFSSRTESSRFKTIISNAYKADTANFAGHYTFIWWGCGSPCQDGLIVDRRTGNIYDVPTASLGYDFRPNSRMLIVNLLDQAGFNYDTFGKPAIYILDEETKEFIERTANIN